MTANSSTEPTFRLADRLAAARRGRFVGREAELELFRSALLRAEPFFAVLHIYGSGGVGKTTLLREYTRIARELDRPLIRLDGRNLEPAPPGFLLALHQALGFKRTDSAFDGSNWPAEGVLLIDTYETLISLDAWLRDTFLPQLSGRSLVVTAGRNPPDPAWRTDIDWAELTQVMPLRNLRPEESQTYLAVRGIPASRHQEVLDFTHGHPLALSLVADLLNQSEPGAAFSFQTAPDVVRILLQRFVHEVPSVNHHLALQVCALAWATTEELLAHVLDTANSAEIFEWLRQLAFIEQGPLGLFPHDLAREVLDADFRWRNPEGYLQLNQRLTTHLHAMFLQANGAKQQRIWFDLLYLARHNPFIKPYFDWTAFHSGFAEPASENDAAAILQMVETQELTGSYAVIHALPVGRLDDPVWQPRYTAYFVTYFNQDVDSFRQCLAPQDWYHWQFVWPYEGMDYELRPWPEAGCLRRDVESGPKRLPWPGIVLKRGSPPLI